MDTDRNADRNWLSSQKCAHNGQALNQETNTLQKFPFYEYYNGSAIANSYHYRYYAIRYGPENVPVSGEIHEAGSLILKYENNTRSKFDRHRTWSKNILKQKVFGKS